MFVQNIGYQFKFAGDVPLTAGMFSPASQRSPRLLRRDYPSNIGTVYFDPSLYILDLSPDPIDHRVLVERIVTYGWFGCECEEYDSEGGEVSIRSWEKSVREVLKKNWKNRVDPTAQWDETVRECVKFQEKLEVSKVILPATLIQDPEDDLVTFFDNLDEAVSVASSLTEIPILASIPIHEDAVKHTSPTESDLLDAVVDRATAVENISGFYLTFCTDGAATNRRINDKNVAESVLWLSHILGHQMERFVLVNNVDMLGVAAVSLGASGFCGGYSTGENRFCLDDHLDSGGGGAYPRFRTLALAGDLLPEDDLEAMTKKNYLRFVEDDRTSYSGALIDALAAGEKSSTVADWEQRLNNIATARRHSSELLATKWTDYGCDPRTALAWLQDGWGRVRQLDHELKSPLKCEWSHLRAWKEALQSVMGM